MSGPRTRQTFGRWIDQSDQLFRAVSRDNATSYKQQRSVEEYAQALLNRMEKSGLSYSLQQRQGRGQLKNKHDAQALLNRMGSIQQRQS